MSRSARLRPPSLARAGVLPLAAALLLAGCGGAPKDDPTAAWNPDQLADTARHEVQAGHWDAARDLLSKLENRYPGTLYAQQALLDEAYVNWKAGENEVALVELERFQRLYPAHPAMDYVLYLKGMANLAASRVTVASFILKDQTERDTNQLRAAFMAFSELRKRFPDSQYAPDAMIHITELANVIAMNEVYVARYYFDHGAYVAAANRAQGVVNDFGEGVPAAEEAFYILKESYARMGLTDLHTDVQQAFEQAYPDSKLLEKNQPKKSWWNPF